MKRELIEKMVFWTMWIIVSVTFLLAAWPKIGDPQGFAKTVYNYQLLPDVLVNPAALYIPWIELAIAVAILLIPRLRRSGLLLAGIMLAVFTLAKGISMYRGIDISCGCFSTDQEGGPISWKDIILNLLLIASVVVGYIGCENEAPETATDADS